MTTNATCYIKRHAGIVPGGDTEGKNYLTAIEPDYKSLIDNPGLRRRMSHIIKMGVAAAQMCLQDDIRPEAIVTATGLGCVGDTEKFAAQILSLGENLLNPSAFIQSTFNTIGAQIALLHKIEAYNMTYVHRALSFESALLDAMLLLDEGRHNILVGAIDEMYETPYTIERRMGLLRNITAGEGAHFFLLDSEPHEACATLLALETGSTPAPADQFIETLLQTRGLQAADIDLWLTGENGNTLHDKPFAALNRLVAPTSRRLLYKKECGEYPTATAAALDRAAREIATGESRYALIYNHSQKYHSVMLCGSL